MAHLCKGTVKRYELPGCNGLNFVLTKCLGKDLFINTLSSSSLFIFLI